jgi:hypothetical protein
VEIAVLEHSLHHFFDQFPSDPRATIRHASDASSG